MMRYQFIGISSEGKRHVLVESSERPRACASAGMPEAGFECVKGACHPTAPGEPAGGLEGVCIDGRHFSVRLTEDWLPAGGAQTVLIALMGMSRVLLRRQFQTLIEELAKRPE